MLGILSRMGVLSINSIGPTLTCSTVQFESALSSLSSQGLSWREVPARFRPTRTLKVKRGLLSMYCEIREQRPGALVFWLTGSTWNPFFWLGQFRLVGVVERIFLASGAQPCDLGEFFDQSIARRSKS